MDDVVIIMISYSFPSITYPNKKNTTNFHNVILYDDFVSSDLDDESSDESEAEMDIDTYASGTKGKHDLMMKNEVSVYFITDINLVIKETY